MNTKRKKILFISCLGGMGHVRAAKALLASAEENHPEFECRYIDAVDYCGWFLRASVVNSYDLLIKHWPQLYKKIYQFADTPTGKSSIDLSSALLKQGNQKFIEYVEDFAPDRIVTTHFFVPTLLGELADRFPVDMVVTDYYANRMWLSPAVRHLFVASETIKKAFQSDHASIIVSGIPVNPRFFKPKNIPELRHKLGLEDAQPVILILSGGTGLIDITAATEQILNNFPAAAVIAIAGKDNTEVFNKLETLAPGRDSYRVFEFIDTIDEWMAVASVVVTKPGGLTTSEVLYLKKPLLMINPLPGQEEKNAAFVTDHNYGRLVADVHELPDLISKILSEPHFLNTPPDLSNPNETILSAQ